MIHKFNNTSKFVGSLIIAALSLFMWSCDDMEPGNNNSNGNNSDPSQTEKLPESTTLVYAVASNNLGGNLIYDKNEMILAAPQIDLDRNNVLVFETRFDVVSNYNSDPVVQLLKLSKADDGKYEWETIKSYTTDKMSLDPTRISEVIDYVINNYQAQNYGLLFWSHSTAANYYPGSKSEAEKVDLPAQYSFGMDLIAGSGNDFFELNVDELANAVPDNLFDYIWFDSCYMSNIESIYQFRGKCNYYVAYPTEVCAEGMPYHITLPYIAKKSPDLVGAAEAFFNYFDKDAYYNLATIAVTDMNKIDYLAEYCSNLYDAGNVASKSGLLKYTNNRQSSGPFYDLGDYTKEMARLSGNEITKEQWDEALSEVVLYKAATKYDFNNHEIEQENYSGISTFVYPFDEEESENVVFYKSLDWFKTVFK